MNHFKDTLFTIIPTTGGLFTALEVTNVGIKILVGIATLIWLGIRIAIAIREYKIKRNG